MSQKDAAGPVIRGTNVMAVSVMEKKRFYPLNNVTAAEKWKNKRKTHELKFFSRFHRFYCVITAGGPKTEGGFVHLILKGENILFNSTKEKHISELNVLLLDSFI